MNKKLILSLVLGLSITINDQPLLNAGRGGDSFFGGFAGSMTGSMIGGAIANSGSRETVVVREVPASAPAPAVDSAESDRLKEQNAALEKRLADLESRMQTEDSDNDVSDSDNEVDEE